MNRATECQGPTQDGAVERDLEVTLEEVYNGSTTKRVRIQRAVLDPNGMTTTQHETYLTIDIKRGWKTGTRIVFPKEGDQGPNKIPADVVFTVKVLEHGTFGRVRDDLVVTRDVTLVKALTNSVITVTTLDDRILRIPINEIIQYVLGINE
jgi:DnaJ family protein B protein 13